MKFEDYLCGVLGEISLQELKGNLMRYWYMSEGDTILTAISLHGYFYYTHFTGEGNESQES